VAGFVSTLRLTDPAVAVLDGATMRTTISDVDFRIEFKCDNGRHYAKLMRGRGSKRTKENGNYEYLGKAEVVAQRGGHYEQRWIEYQFKHACNHA
jgi:hypothetical protein